MMTAEDHIQRLSELAREHDYYSLALVVVNHQRSTLIHHCDIDRLPQLHKLMEQGGIPVAILAIVKLEHHGFFACSKVFNQLPGVTELVQQETENMKMMLAEADWAKPISACITELVQ